MIDKKDRDVNAGEVESSERYLQFDLGDEAYAIPLLSVKEVIPVPDTTPLPNVASFYVGIMNLRGQIISIVDLRKKLNINHKKNDSEEAVVIVQIDEVSVGLIVDAIQRVLNVPIESISEVPEINSQVNAKHIEGIYQGDKALVVLLDLASVLNINEIKKNQNKAA